MSLFLIYFLVHLVPAPLGWVDSLPGSVVMYQRSHCFKKLTVPFPIASKCSSTKDGTIEHLPHPWDYSDLRLHRTCECCHNFLKVHMCFCPVMFSKRYYLKLIHHFWLLQPLHPFWEDAWTLKGGMNINTPFSVKHAKVSYSLHVDKSLC